MATKWYVIKDRVEMKVGEEIDISTFNVLANEAIADLNEVAYIIAPVLTVTSANIAEKHLGCNFARHSSAIKLPEDFSTIIKLDVIDRQGNVIKAKETSINSFTINDYDRGNQTWDVAFYIFGDEIVLFTPEKVNEVRIYYTRRMAVLKSIDEQDVELENNFENLLTFSICHKWLENFVGTEDQETTAMFQKYQLLKKEYEEKNLPKKTNKRQSRITVI